MACSSPIGFPVSRCRGSTPTLLTSLLSFRHCSVYDIPGMGRFHNSWSYQTRVHVALTSSHSLIGHWQVSPQMPSYSALMPSETPLVSLCGRHSTSHGKIHSAFRPTKLNTLQEPCPMGCHHLHQFYFRGHSPLVTIPVLA